MGWLNDKLNLLKIIILSMRIEPFVFLFVLGTNLSEITRTQLIQDKFCLNNYNQSRQYCIELKDTKDNGDPDQTVNDILADVATFSSYLTIISTLPGFFYVLMIGPWIDRYIHARKIILCVGMIGYAGWYSLQLLNAIYLNWDVYYFLLTYIPVTLVGGWASVWMTGYSYMTNNTPEEYRFIKFVSWEIAMFTAGPTGIYLGGKMLGNGNHSGTGSLHNYEQVFLVSTCSALVAFFWVLFVVNETNNEQTRDINQNELEKCENNERDYGKFKLREMFDWKNLKDIYETSVRVRPNKGRLQVWLLFASMCLLTLSDGKVFQIVFPFAEKVYDWNAKHFSDIKSLASVTQIVSMALIPPLLSNYLKLSETLIGIVGITSIFFADIAIGSVIAPAGLYLMYGLGSVSGMASIVIRSLLSKTVTETESGRVFALLGALEQVFPSVQSLAYNWLFATTIDWYPSLSFQLCAAINLLTIFVFIWIDVLRENNCAKS